MMRGAWFLAGALALAVGAACSDDLGAGGDNAGGDFSISVGSGNTPQYTWPGGPAVSVTVVRAANQTQFVWAVSSPTLRNIASPLRHGTVPQGAIELADDERTLTPGVRYRVSISLADGQSAFQEFTP